MTRRCIFIVVNNGMYGTIRMHQEREYPARVYGTALRNPDFARWRRHMGAYGEVVEKTAEFAPAFEQAMSSGRPALLELRIDPEAITTRTSLSAIREKALRAARRVHALGRSRIRIRQPGHPDADPNPTRTLASVR